MRHRSTIVIGILVCLAAGPAAGTTITLRRDGIPSEERGEVCRFRAADRESPFQRWLASQEVSCVPAGSPVDFPPGLWNVFARTGGAVSPSPLLVDAGAAPDTLSLDLEPAATVVPLLPPARSGVIYVPRRGSAYPVAEGIGRLAVPAGEELWLLVLEKSAPVALVPVAAIEAGSERRVDARSGGPGAIIGWLRVHEADRAALTEARGISPPVVRASSGGPWLDGDPLPPLDLLHGAFLRVRDVEAGEAELIVEGRGWIPDRRRMTVGPAL
ncbi:MAG TPA: hypothetical protein VNA04_03425, partial [Thermoanaerobaculia bacterium]|nr:hypothetical protein [Thermoanaerobaculia bacterium]